MSKTRSFMAITFAVLVSLLFITSVTITPVRAGGHGAKHASSEEKPIPGGDTINISGIILDNHKEPISEVEVLIRVNGKEIDRIETASNGKYISRFQLEKDSVQNSTIHVEAHKTSFKSQILELKGNELAQKGSHYFSTDDIEMPRILGSAFWVSTIAFELLHRTVAAMLGAAFMLLVSYTIGTINPDFHIFSFDRAIHAIDMNVIFLLMGMMIIVGVLKHTGVFQ